MTANRHAITKNESMEDNAPNATTASPQRPTQYFSREAIAALTTSETSIRKVRTKTIPNDKSRARSRPAHLIAESFARAKCHPGWPSARQKRRLHRPAARRLLSAWLIVLIQDFAGQQHLYGLSTRRTHQTLELAEYLALRGFSAEEESRTKLPKRRLAWNVYVARLRTRPQANPYRAESTGTRLARIGVDRR
jgi:hypothetical protein